MATKTELASHSAWLFRDSKGSDPNNRRVANSYRPQPDVRFTEPGSDSSRELAAALLDGVTFSNRVHDALERRSHLRQRINTRGRISCRSLLVLYFSATPRRMPG